MPTIVMATESRTTLPSTNASLSQERTRNKGKVKMKLLNWALFPTIEQNMLAKNIRQFFPTQCNISFYHPFLEVYARNNLHTKRLNHQYRLVEIQHHLDEFDLHVKQYRAQIMRKRLRGGISFETRHVVIKEIALLPINLLTVYNTNETLNILPTSHSRIAIQYLYSPSNPAYLELFASYLCSYLVETEVNPHFPLLYGTASVLFKFFTYAVAKGTSPYLNPNKKIRSYMKNDTTHYVVPRVPVQLIFQESLKFRLDEILAHEGYCAKIWKSYLFQVLSALSIVYQKYRLCHNDLHIGNVMYSATRHKYLYYTNSNGNIYRVPTYGKILKLIDWGRATLTYHGQEYSNLCFSCEGDAFSQFNWNDQIIPSRPLQKPHVGIDIVLFVHSLATSQSQLPKDTFTQYCHHLCTLPVVGDIITKHQNLSFKLYQDVSKHAGHLTPQQQLAHPIFKSYLVSNPDSCRDMMKYRLD